MRSLWRLLALRWLGGEGSEALTAESGGLDILLSAEHALPLQAFDVRREPEVSQHAMMAQDGKHPPEAQPAPQEVARSGLRRRDSR